MMIPPMHMIGAETMSVQVISTSIWTCCTSLVFRVISDGAPELGDLPVGERADLMEQRGAQVAAEAHRGAGAVVDRDDRGHDLDDGDAQHHRTGGQR